MFTASQFTPTQWDTAEDKAKFANHFVRFVENGFKQTLFHKWFYKRLSMCFGHIAHFNQAGFYDVQFGSLVARRDFLAQCHHHPHYGDPAFTYSDVEKVLGAWVLTSGQLDTLQDAITNFTERTERAELSSLQAKYRS
jgi:hypothetical protein